MRVCGSSLIKDVTGIELLDSRGNPTPGAFVTLRCGIVGEGISPSGASTGEGERHERRDGDKLRYGGKGVLTAVAKINEVIGPALQDMDVEDLVAIDRAMVSLDTTGNLDDLGANSTTAVSWACADALRQVRQQPLFRVLGGPNACRLPVPLCKFMDGGRHADNNLTVQEFMYAPVGAPDFPTAVRWLRECFGKLMDLVSTAGHPTTVGDEGGLAPNLRSNREALTFGMQSIEQAGLRPGEDICFALDPAASEFLEGGLYKVEPDEDPVDGLGLVDYWDKLFGEFPIVSGEDLAGQKDYDTWRLMMGRFGDRIQLIGDDIFCTNLVLFALSLPPNDPLANAILIKVNQIGTVTEAEDTAEQAHKHGYATCVSQRSGDTEHPHYASLAVAVGAGFIKPGGICRSERISKYNQLLRIWQLLGDRAIYPGWQAFTSVPALYTKGVK